jgi:hypothetical protein
MLAPKWFDKDPARSNADNAEQLRTALRLAGTLYKSILNRARCEVHDLALVSLLGLTYVEKNGHHYVNGMAGRPAAEQRRFLEAHPDLYAAGDPVRLRIERGQVTIRSLDCAGFATAVEPDWESMREMASSRVHHGR